MVKHVLSIM